MAATINFAGLASGIDTNALIDSQSAATRAQRVTPYEEKKTQLSDESDALTEFKTKLETLQEKAKVFSTLSGGGLAKEGVSSNEAVVSATASNSAANGTHTITTTAKAKNATMSIDNRYASTTTSMFPGVNDTITFTIGQAPTATVVPLVFNGTTTLADAVSQFNSQTTVAQASVVNVGTVAVPSYAFVVNSASEGLAKGNIAYSAGGTFPAFTATTSQATNAVFTVSGIAGTITRESNTVSDVIAGVTLNISGTGTSTVTVNDDVTTTASRVQEFVDSYNEIVKYIADNNTISRDESTSQVKNVYGTLARTRTDDSALTSLRDALAATVFNAGTAVRIFPDIGITTERDGTLKFDSEKFTTAMGTDSDSVNEVLKNYADRTTPTGGTIDLLTRFNGTVDITINSNKTQIDNLTTRISEAEAYISKQEDALRAKFARMETAIAKLQSQQSALTSSLSSLR